MEKVKSFGTAGSGGAWSAVWVALRVTWDDVLTGAPEPPPEEDDAEPEVGTVVGIFVAAAVVRSTVMVATAFVFVRTGVFVASVDGSGAFVPGAGVTGGCLAWSWGERNTMTAIMTMRRMNPAATTGSNEGCGPGSGVSMGVPPRGIPFLGMLSYLLPWCWCSIVPGVPSIASPGPGSLVAGRQGGPP